MMKKIVYSICILLWPFLAWGEESYIAKNRHKHESGGGSSYIESLKAEQKKTEALTAPLPESNSYLARNRGRIKEGSGYIGSLKVKQTKKVSTVSTSDSYVSSREQSPSPRLNMSSDDDLSFNPSDFEKIDLWAKKNGKLSQVKKVADNYGWMIKELALEFGVDYRVIIALCAHESGGNPNVVSYAGACGLMQLMPTTAAHYGLFEDKIFDPYQNLRAGTNYFSDMLALFGNNRDAIYAYGWGQGNARKGINNGVQSSDISGIQEVLYLAQAQ